MCVCVYVSSSRERARSYVMLNYLVEPVMEAKSVRACARSGFQ